MGKQAYRAYNLLGYEPDQLQSKMPHQINCLIVTCDLFLVYLLVGKKVRLILRLRVRCEAMNQKRNDFQ